MVEAAFPQIGRVRTRIGPRGRGELKQLDLESRIRSLEREGDVLRFHARHAHVPGGRTTVDRQNVLLPEAKEREEFDRRPSVGHRDRNMIRIEEHLAFSLSSTPRTRPRRLTSAESLPALAVAQSTNSGSSI